MPGNFSLAADFSRRDLPEGWSVDGVGVRNGWVESGDFTVALKGSGAVGMLLPAGLFTHALSPRLNGAVRTPFLNHSGRVLRQHGGGRRRLQCSPADRGQFVPDGAADLSEGPPSPMDPPFDQGGRQDQSFAETPTSPQRLRSTSSWRPRPRTPTFPREWDSGPTSRRPKPGMPGAGSA